MRHDLIPELGKVLYLSYRMSDTFEICFVCTYLLCIFHG